MFPMMRMLTRNRSFRISKMAVELMSWGFRGFIGALRLLCFDHRGCCNRGEIALEIRVCRAWRGYLDFPVSVL
jgi:hypothetical protein